MYILEYLKQAVCSFKTKYHLYCPCCGSTRALNELLSLRIIDSLRSNPIVVMLLFDLVLYLIMFALYKMHVLSKLKLYRVEYIGVITTLLVWLVFAVVRNIMLLGFGYDYLGDIIF